MRKTNEWIIGAILVGIMNFVLFLIYGMWPNMLCAVGVPVGVILWEKHIGRA